MIGHEWARESLRRAAARGRLGHAYLVTGPPSVGKTTLALELAALLVCEDAHARPCGLCRACRHLARGAHPDVRLIERAEDRRDLTIEQIRALEDEIALAPYEAPRKLYCLVGAEAMNEAAASALLKTLEEPPAHATLVLAATEAEALPSTIRSRCRRISLQPVPAERIAEGLAARHGVEPARARELATLAHGRPGWAVRALAEPALAERERAARAGVAALASAGPYSRLVLVDEWLGKGSFLESRERALAFLAHLEGWWRDALLWVLDAEGRGLRRFLLSDLEPPRWDAGAIAAFLGRIQAAAARVEANVAPRLVLEQLMDTMHG